jgi:hypothetical protein
MLVKALLCATVVESARISKDSAETEELAVGSVGQISEVFTTGAPAVSIEPLRNNKAGNGCFKGARYFTKDYINYKDKVDIVPMLAYLGSFVHPMMDAVQLHVQGWEGGEKVFGCSASNKKVPDGYEGEMGLHMPPAYIEAGSKVSTNLKDKMAYLSWLSSNQNPAEVKEWMGYYGYGVAGHSFDNGGDVQGGPQVGYLWQHKQTLECMVTFQGSLSLKDWIANVNMQRADFCGLPTTVHEGFKTHLLMMVKNPSWQSNVRAKLSKCSKVQSVGMSLGAAKAELFAACINQAPTYGSGKADFDSMSWMTGTPQMLSYL